MRVAFFLPLLAGLISTNMSAGVVEYSAAYLNTNLYSDGYSLSGMTVQANQLLDIRFDPTLYGGLSSPQVPDGFTSFLLQPNNPPGTFAKKLVTPSGTCGLTSFLLQPNNPPGTFGDFEIMPLTGSLSFDLSLAAQFSVDVVLLNGGKLGPQPYFIYQFDANGNYLFTAEAGETVFNDGTQGVPEPVVFPLVGIALLAGSAWWHIRKRTVRARAGR